MPEVAEPPVAAAPPPASPSPAPGVPDLTKPAASAPGPRPGSARERMHRGVAEKLNLEVPPTVTPKTTDEPAKTPKQPEAPRTGEEPAAGDPHAEKPEPPPDVTPEQKKQNPWKLYKAEKARAEALERQMAEGKSSSLAEAEKTKYEEKVTQLETKLKTYEDEIRFKSYEKSEEFRTKYEQPYEKAWEKHMHDLREVPVLAEDGSQRLATAEDLLALVNVSLPEARKMATEKWGDFAQDAMLARKEIRDLFDSKNNALTEARKTGAEREKQTHERAAKWQEAAKKHVSQVWEESNKQALSDPNNGEFFKPVEGDDTRNQLLGKGFALVDKAFSENPMDPNLTPEQRAEVVKRHAAVRNRAASFAVMKHIVRKLQAKIAALEKSNGQFKESEPPRAGGTSTTAAPAATRARDRMYQAQEKFVKP